MWGIPCAVRWIVASAASAPAGSTRHASTAAIKASGPLTAGGRIGVVRGASRFRKGMAKATERILTGHATRAAPHYGRGLHALQGRQRPERDAAVRRLLQVRGQRPDLRD